MGQRLVGKFDLSERSDHWLQQFADSIWRRYFSEVKRKTPLEVRFGKRARNRLGSLSYDPKRKVSVLRVTGLFKDADVPEMIIKATVVHELCHYAHGFHSGLDRKHKYPHAGGVIRHEFAERGLEDLYLEQKRWLRDNWLAVVRRHYPGVAKCYRRLRIRIF